MNKKIYKTVRRDVIPQMDLYDDYMEMGPRVPAWHGNTSDKQKRRKDKKARQKTQKEEKLKTMSLEQREKTIAEEKANNKAKKTAKKARKANTATSSGVTAKQVQDAINFADVLKAACVCYQKQQGMKSGPQKDVSPKVGTPRKAVITPTIPEQIVMQKEKWKVISKNRTNAMAKGYKENEVEEKLYFILEMMAEKLGRAPLDTKDANEQIVLLDFSNFLLSNYQTLTTFSRQVKKVMKEDPKSLASYRDAVYEYAMYYKENYMPPSETKKRDLATKKEAVIKAKHDAQGDMKSAREAVNKARELEREKEKEEEKEKELKAVEDLENNRQLEYAHVGGSLTAKLDTLFGD